MKKEKKFLALAVLFCFCSCGISAKGIGRVVSTGSERRAELNERLKKFGQSMYWAGQEELSVFFHPEKDEELSASFEKELEGKKLKDFKVEKLDCDEAVESCKARVKIEYFKIPEYIVITRKEHETWKYSRFSGGWALWEVE